LYTARELFPHQTILEEDDSSLETDDSSLDSAKQTKLVSFVTTDHQQDKCRYDQWLRIPEEDMGPWYGLQASSIISDPSTTNDFQQVQRLMTEPGFVEYFMFDMQDAARDYVTNN
jgi:hypothetical protein